MGHHLSRLFASPPGEARPLAEARVPELAQADPRGALRGAAAACRPAGRRPAQRQRRPSRAAAADEPRQPAGEAGRDIERGRALRPDPRGRPLDGAPRGRAGRDRAESRSTSPPAASTANCFWPKSPARSSARGRARSWVTIEITETAGAADLEQAAAWVARLTALGCRVSLDDFGTGYGAFTYLNRLAVCELKIDRANSSPGCATARSTGGWSARSSRSAAASA